MADIKAVVQTATSHTVTGFSSTALNAGTYAESASAINNTTNDPLDVLVEVRALCAGALSAGKQIVVFAKASLDGTTFGSGPVAGDTATTNEPDLHFVGTVPINDANAHRKTFSLAAAFGGILPPYVKLVIKNDSGSVTDANGTVRIAEVWGTSS